MTDYVVSPGMKYWVCDYCGQRFWFEEDNTGSGKLQFVLDHVQTHSLLANAEGEKSKEVKR